MMSIANPKKERPDTSEGDRKGHQLAMTFSLSLSSPPPPPPPPPSKAKDLLFSFVASRTVVHSCTMKTEGREGRGGQKQTAFIAMILSG